MVEPSPTCTCYLPRNLSYDEENYHPKYYYPAVYRGDYKVARQAKNNQTRGCQRDKISAPTQKIFTRVMETDTERCQVCGCEAGLQLSSDRNNSSATVSSDCDTVFSEDYTDMTDVDFKPQSEGEAASDQDGDSTYTSDRSSVSTLENGLADFEEPQDGSNGESSKVDSSASRKQKPEIKLILNTPPLGRKMENMPVFDSSGSLCDSDDEEFNFLGTQPVRRATSLKTYKTPPGTPGRKKAVRFADALGLDLESVRHILNLEDPPTVPTSALRDLKLTSGENDEKRIAFQAGVQAASGGAKYLYACFQQPGIDARFLDRVRSQKVALENCLVDDREMTVSGTIRVANIAFHKSITIRYTVNNWLTFTDVNASYVLNSNDGPTDRFSFTIAVPHYFSPGSRLALCIMYRAGSDTFWDSNNGSNYVIECYARHGSTTFNDADNSWMHFI